MARALRRVGLAQVPAREPRPEPAAHGPRLRGHLLLTTGPTPRRRWRRRWARSTRSCGRARRSTPASRTTRRSRPRRPPRILRRARHALPHPPARATSCSTAGSRTACSTCSSAEGIGCIAFSPLAQGLLTDRYLARHPEGLARRQAARLPASPSTITADKVGQGPAAERHRRGARPDARPDGARVGAARPVVTSALIGASSVAQLDDNLGALKAPALSAEELARIETILK